MFCVQQDANGFLVAVTPQPAEASNCMAVVISGAEASQLQSIWQPLTLEEGGLIGSAIWAAWFAAWGFRVLIRQAGSPSIDSGSEN